MEKGTFDSVKDIIGIPVESSYPFGRPYVSFWGDEGGNQDPIAKAAAFILMTIILIGILFWISNYYSKPVKA